MRSQHGPLASAHFTVLPTSRMIRDRGAVVPPLVLPSSPFSPSPCPCVPADVAANSTLWPPSRSVPSGRVLGRRGVPSVCGLHRSSPRTCSSATWIWVTSMHWMFGDWKLTLWAQLAIDTTLASPLKADRTARNRTVDRDGAVLVEGRKERTCPELSGEGGRGSMEH